MSAPAMRTRLALVASAALLVLAVVVPSAARAASAPVFVDAHDIHVVTTTEIDDRQYDVEIVPAALGRDVHVRVLLPAGYGDSTTTRYPVLYLFHGTSGRAADWVTKGDAEPTTAPLDLITVMPDAGFNGDGGGWFTDWVDTTTAEGPSQWETFHVAELIPWVDANLRTIPSRAGRAVAGLSQGGFGSMTYAARHPDQFVAAASFSGAPEIDRDPDVITGSTVVVEGTAFGLDHVEPEAMFGSRVTNEINWQGHDPAMLLTNLRGMALFLWTATGAPGPYDSQPNVGASGIEYLTHVSTQHFHDHLVEAGIPSYYDDYVDGTHTWAYWARDLREFVGPMMAAFANPPVPPTISYRSIDAAWTQWGWSVSLTRAAAQEFSSLDGAGPSGFVLRGTGTATVVTPATYVPGATIAARVSDAAGTREDLLIADGAGRLDVTVHLGTALSPVAAEVQFAQ